MQRLPLPAASLQTMRELARKSVDRSDATIAELTIAAALLEALNEIDRLKNTRPPDDKPDAASGATPRINYELVCWLSSTVADLAAAFDKDEATAYILAISARCQVALGIEPSERKPRNAHRRRAT